MTLCFIYVCFYLQIYYSRINAYFLFTGIYLTVTMAMTSLSIILTVFVLQLHHVGPHQRPVPKWLKFICVRILAKIMCMNTSQFPVRYRRGYRRDRDVCLTTFFDSDGNSHCNGNIPQHSVSYQPDKIHDVQVEREQTQEKITKHLKILVEKQDYEDYHQDIVYEWRFVALCMDRILFWVFLFAAILSSIMILIVQPLRKPSY